MLERLRLQNFALFVDQSVEFENGFNSLLGETGAGKSIIIDALSFVIGAKSDKIVIRYGESSTKVEAVFSELSQNAKNLLEEAGIEFDDSIIVSRSLNISGKNDIRVNGNFVTLTFLKELGACLINIFGQHELSSMTKITYQFLIRMTKKRLVNSKIRLGNCFVRVVRLMNKLILLAEIKQHVSEILTFWSIQ